MPATIQLVFPLLLLLLTDGALGKLPPTVPPCPANQVAQVSRCQEKAKRLLIETMPSRRYSLLYMFTDHIHAICKKVQKYSKCNEFINVEECELRDNAYYEDHEVLSIYPLCQHKYVYERHSRLHFCLDQYRSRVRHCHTRFRSRTRKATGGRGRLHRGGWTVNEEACRYLDNYQNCIALFTTRQCGLVKLKELAMLLVQATVPHSYNCTVLRSMQNMKRSGISLRHEDSGNGPSNKGTNPLLSWILAIGVPLNTLSILLSFHYPPGL